jgi:hypothetical protein
VPPQGHRRCGRRRPGSREWAGGATGCSIPAKDPARGDDPSGSRTAWAASAPSRPRTGGVAPGTALAEDSPQLPPDILMASSMYLAHRRGMCGVGRKSSLPSASFTAIPPRTSSSPSEKVRVTASGGRSLPTRCNWSWARSSEHSRCPWPPSHGRHGSQTCSCRREAFRWSSRGGEGVCRWLHDGASRTAPAVVTMPIVIVGGGPVGMTLALEPRSMTRPPFPRTSSRAATGLLSLGRCWRRSTTVVAGLRRIPSLQLPASTSRSNAHGGEPTLLRLEALFAQTGNRPGWHGGRRPRACRTRDRGPAGVHPHARTRRGRSAATRVPAMAAGTRPGRPSRR